MAGETTSPKHSIGERLPFFFRKISCRSKRSKNSRRRGRKLHAGKPALAHHVYWQGLSLDKACEIIRFCTQISITKSQADKLLYQLSHEPVNHNAVPNGVELLFPY
jgi:hypothetical protein